ncbi:MAG TPA: NAD-dependent epimerase/dehydratase family protein [Desulfomonilia bacterium]
MLVSEDISSIISRVGDKFYALSGQNLFITGGTGFIGSYLLKTLAYLNDTILIKPCRTFILTRNPYAFFAKMPDIASRDDFITVKGNVSEFTFDQIKCDYIIHAATTADPFVTNNDPLGSMETITSGTLNVLKLAETNKVKSFLYLSSGAVYGTQPVRLKQIPEDFLQGPDITTSTSGYAEGKRYAEVLSSIYRERYCMQVKVARLFTFVGPYIDLNAQYAVTDFIKKCQKQEPIIINSDGTLVRSYCYSTDVAVALWEILLGETDISTFNVGSDDGISISELAEFVSSCFNKKVPVMIKEPALPEKLPARYLPDISKLKETFDFKLQYDSLSAVKRSIDWLMENNL